MSLVRMQIRKELISVLSGRTVAKDRVRFNRGEVNWDENLPAINLYFRGEQIDQNTESPREMKRSLQLEIELLTHGVDGEELSDRLDEFAEQVERCLSVDDSIGGCASDIFINGVSDVETEASGTRVIGAFKLNYTIEFYEFFPRDRKGQGRFDDFEVYAEYDLNGEQAAADRATDEFDPEP